MFQWKLKNSYEIILKTPLSFQVVMTRREQKLIFRSGLGDLVAFGRPFINNPDLVERFKNNWPLSKDLQSGFILYC